MATRRQYPADCSEITTRLSQYEPRDEHARLPKSNGRILRPKPLNIPSKRPEDTVDVKVPTLLRNASSESQEPPQDPQIVDIEPTPSWQRKASLKHSQSRKPSPNIASTRQSEISLGILDYYMREPSPVIKSPTLPPPPPTPKLDPAIERFDFELPATPTPSTNVPTISGILSSRCRATTRTQSDQPLIPISPPSQPRPSANLNRGYTLFPAIKEVTPPRKPQITSVEPLTRQDTTPTSVGSSVSSPPETTYRPRKESISSSIRTRNDSINSFQARLNKQRQPIPLRILSLNTQTSSPSCNRRTTSNSISPPSAGPGDEYKNRWSDDSTITSPSLAPTPGPRTSFASLLRRDSTQYPACFFEDDDEDDEAAPLRKKWAWKTSTSWAGTERESRALRKGVREIYEPDEVKGGFWRGLVCGCAGR